MVIESREKYMEHVMEHKTYDYTVNGECCQCGECCGNILPLTEKEKKEIRRYIKANGIKERREMIPLAEPVYDMTCPFLQPRKKDHKCSIYEVRPEICRAYRCDKSPIEIINTELLNGERHVVNMREEFYGR